MSKSTEGDQVHYVTGAKRSSDAERFRADLISPIGLMAVAETCAEGARKYDDFNWEKGMPISDLLNHAIIHIYKYLAGDRSEDHLAHAAWNLLAAIHSEALWPHLNEQLRSDGLVPPVDVDTRNWDLDAAKGALGLLEKLVCEQQFEGSPTTYESTDEASEKTATAAAKTPDQDDVWRRAIRDSAPGQNGKNWDRV